MGVKCVSVVRVELSMLSETSWQIWVGQIVSSKANQVCVIFLQARYCTLPVVSTCKPTHPATMNAAQAHCRQGNSWHCCCNPCKPISSARVPSIAPLHAAKQHSLCSAACHASSKVYSTGRLKSHMSHKFVRQQRLICTNQ